VQKQFWDKKASVKLHMTDAFYTNKAFGYTHLASAIPSWPATARTSTSAAIRRCTISFNHCFGKTLQVLHAEVPVVQKRKHGEPASAAPE
jgi:hypothetical protein